MSIKMMKFSDVAEVVTGSTPPTKDPENYGDLIPFVKPPDLNGSVINETKSYLSEKGRKLARIIPRNSVLVGCIGTLGKIGIAGRELSTNQQINALVFNENLVYPRYGFHYCKTIGPLLKSMAPATTVSLVNKSRFSAIKMPVPPLDEQKRIAAILDKANEIEEQSKKTLLMRNNLIVSTFLEMFGDPVVNPKQWKLVSMKDLADKIGSGSTPRGGKKSYVENGISLVRSMNIHDDRFVEKDLAKITDEQANLLNNVILNENDVLLNITGASVCRCAVVPSQILPARVNQHVCILRPKTTIIKSEYLLHCLISANYKKMLLQLSGGGGATREALTKEQIKHLQIPIPPIEMQNKFVKFIQSVNDLTLSANRKIQSNKDLCNSAAQLIYT
ncbi:restriction endonuclease subunit S [Euryarchaeota archaeon]|nr:restriction endonuclease subunit S [Euryarchaeota archaeon]